MDFKHQIDNKLLDKLKSIEKQLKLNNEEPKSLTDWKKWIESRTHNSRFAKAGVSCFYDSLVRNKSAVLRLNFYAKIHPTPIYKTLAHIWNYENHINNIN